MFYRWPQGRIIRTILLVLTLLVAGDLAWNGAWGNIQAARNPAEVLSTTAFWVYGIILGSLALAVVIGGLLCIGFLHRTVDFLIEVEHEMARVTWPGRSEVVRATIVISIMTVVLSLLIFAVDFINKFLVYDWILGEGGAS